MINRLALLSLSSHAYQIIVVLFSRLGVKAAPLVPLAVSTAHLSTTPTRHLSTAAGGDSFKAWAGGIMRPSFSNLLVFSHLVCTGGLELTH